jgi:hypothetical protein
VKNKTCINTGYKTAKLGLPGIFMAVELLLARLASRRAKRVIKIPGDSNNFLEAIGKPFYQKGF